MRIIDGHSHMYQMLGPSDDLAKSVKEIPSFDINLLLKRLDEIGVSQIQIMPQEMTRMLRYWLGSNELAADIQQCAPRRIISFAAAEPIDTRGAFNRVRLKEVEKAIVEKGLKGFLLTPPYGHYYSNDKRVYPFYEMAVELDIPIYFHHSHQCGTPPECPLKYARVWLLDDLTIDFPELRFNVEHMGYPWTEELLAIMARSPNVYTDIAMFLRRVYIEDTSQKVYRPILLARNLGMAREYGVLDRVLYGSDLISANVDQYINLLQQEITDIKTRLNSDMKKLGYPPLTQQEMEGLLSKNVLKLWKLK